MSKESLSREHPESEVSQGERRMRRESESYGQKNSPMPARQEDRVRFALNPILQERACVFQEDPATTIKTKSRHPHLL